MRACLKVTSPVVPVRYDEELNDRIANHAGHEFRIYGDDKASIWAVVDEEDYHWLLRYKWCVKESDGRRGKKPKPYLRRAVGVNGGGVRLSTYTLYLHVEVMKKTGIVQPCHAHSLVDHLDGDTLNCRRANLRWATPSMNRLNINGLHAQQGALL